MGRPGDAAGARRARRGGPARADRRADPDSARGLASRTSRCRPPSRCREPLVDAVGEDAVFTRPRGPASATRTAAATPTSPGCGSGRSTPLPTRSSCPPTPTQVRRVLEVCAAEGVAVVPFGGGTSVVGGVAPERGPHGRLISLDLARLRGVEVDRRSLTATLGAGLRGPEAEAALNREGLVLGHCPQSFEYATIGGFAATRSAGQASSGYGRFDDLVSSVRLIAPAGDLRTLETPAHGRRPGAARADRRLRGSPRRDPRRHRPGPPAAEGAPLRGLDRRGLRGRRGDRPRASPRGPACRT